MAPADEQVTRLFDKIMGSSGVLFERAKVTLTTVAATGQPGASTHTLALHFGCAADAIGFVKAVLPFVSAEVAGHINEWLAAPSPKA